MLSYEPKREGTSARAASAEAGAGVDEREQRKLRREAEREEFLAKHEKKREEQARKRAESKQ